MHLDPLSCSRFLYNRKQDLLPRLELRNTVMVHVVNLPGTEYMKCRPVPSQSLQLPKEGEALALAGILVDPDFSLQGLKVFLGSEVGRTVEDSSFSMLMLITYRWTLGRRPSLPQMVPGVVESVSHVLHCPRPGLHGPVEGMETAWR
jgi:hypothetical protein